MKRIGLTIIVALLFSVFQPCMALKSDINIDIDQSGYIVKLKEQKEDSAILLESIDLREVSDNAGLYHANTLSEISKLGDKVEYFEPDYTVTLYSLPDDKYAAKQWSIESLGMSYAWDKGYNGAGIRIAVIDSGVNSLHEDFEKTNFDKGLNVLNGSHDVTDEMGHGTFVCGVLGATRNNSIGISGFSTDATIVPIKCFSSSLDTSASYIVSAIYQAVDNYNCDVINLSLGMEKNMQSMEDAVEYATNKGVIIISAVGNDGTSKLNYPAAYNRVIGVGSVDSEGIAASFSQKNDSVYVVAPGIDVVSLSNKSTSSYAIGEGTSYSAPHVTVAATILKQFAPNATYNDFATLLRESSIDRGDSGYDITYGYGSLNIENFVKAMEAYDFGDIGDIYPDVEGHWATESIRFCVNNGLFNGVTSSSFQPETNMTRAMFVTVLSRMSGESISGFPNNFSDVANGAWYAQASAWGSATGIVSGTGNGEFNPDENITREEMAVFLYRYAKLYNHSDGTYNPLSLKYNDGAQISSWANSAMAWANQNGLITGRSENNICPLENAKRSEVATIITRFKNTFAE